MCLSFAPHSQDAQIEKEKQAYNVTGGCTALAVVYLLGKLYVANAGDSRCVCLSPVLSIKGSIKQRNESGFWLSFCHIPWASPWHINMLEKRQLQTMELLVLLNLNLHEPLLFCVCRAIIIRNNDIIPMSTEFTPESERQRLQFLVRKLLSEPEYRQIFAVRSAVYMKLHAQHIQLEAGDPGSWTPLV